ncbi:MAG: rhodanese-like domain-containing protein [Gemmatimonadota bacterium]
MTATITREQLKDKMDRGDTFYLVETLGEEAYAPAHLPGAVNLPPDQIRDRAAYVLPDRAAEIVVYCASPT